MHRKKISANKRFSSFAKATADREKRVMGFRLRHGGYTVTSWEEGKNRSSKGFSRFPKYRSHLKPFFCFLVWLFR